MNSKRKVSSLTSSEQERLVSAHQSRPVCLQCPQCPQNVLGVSSECPQSDETSLCEVLLHPSLYFFNQERLPANKRTNKRSVPVCVPSQTNAWVKLPEFLQSERSRFPPCVSQSAILNPRGQRSAADRQARHRSIMGLLPVRASVTEALRPQTSS